MIPAFPVYLFDIDGTLLDSAQDICGAIQQVLAVNPSRRPVTFDDLKGYIGRHLFDLFADVMPDPTQERMDDLLAQYRSVYLARGHSQTRPPFTPALPKAWPCSAAARAPPPPKAALPPAPSSSNSA